MLNGILNIYKETGFTSNDVIAKLRGILHQKKIGHAGTLDPAATGVLPVLLGSATRLSEYIMDHEKTYRCCMLLGVETDTQDMTGTVISGPVNVIPDEEAVRRAVLSFVGGYEQLPPMYSAKQVGGRRLYDLAREGIVVDRKKVFVAIANIRIEHIELPEVTFSVDCGKGTYIRTLCHDIGQKLGCGGTMKSLERTRAGGFFAEDAITLERVSELAGCGRIGERVIPVEEMFLDCLRVRTQTMEAEKKLENGNPLTMRELSLPPQGAGGMIRVCRADGTFLAVYRHDAEGSRYVPYRMFLS